MSFRIGERLVVEGLISERELEEALTAQQIYGGRLGTVLVEHGFVKEDELARVLSRHLGAPTVEREKLADLDPELIRMVSPQLARKFGIVPFLWDGDRKRLHLAMANPTNLQVSDEIQFALGRRVELHLAPEIVLGRALEKYYGVPRERRFIRLEGVAPSRSGAFQQDTRPVEASRPAGRRRNGMIERIVEAPTKEELLTTVVDSMTRLAEQSVLLVVRGEELTGWSARGIGVSDEQVHGTRIPLQGASVLLEALRSRQPRRLAAITDAGLRSVLEGRLLVDCDRRVAVLPLIVNERPFGVFLLSGLEARFPEDPAVLGELMRRVAWRLQAFQLMEYVAAPLAGCP